MPIGIANSMPAIISSSVGPMVEAISSITILLEMIERPRSPCIDAPDVFGELDDDRPVETELEADRGDRLGLRVGTGDDRRGIRRHHLHQAKAQEQHAQQRRERDQEPMDDLASHIESVGSDPRARAAIPCSSASILLLATPRTSLLPKPLRPDPSLATFVDWKRYSFPGGVSNNEALQRSASKCVGTCCRICTTA